jgi:hypothetical protein
MKRRTILSKTKSDVEFDLCFLFPFHLVPPFLLSQFFNHDALDAGFWTSDWTA